VHFGVVSQNHILNKNNWLQQCIYTMAANCFKSKILDEMKVSSFLLSLLQENRHSAYAGPLYAIAESQQNSKNEKN